MTGYGQGVFESDAFQLAIDIKSVNNRYLDMHTRLPTELLPFEQKIKRQVQSSLHRGRIDITCTLRRTSDIECELNLPLARSYFAAMQNLQQQLAIGGQIDINEFVRLPGIIQPPLNRATDMENFPGLNETLTQALNQLIAMREKEGAELATELRQRLQNIEALLPEIEVIAQRVPGYYQEKLRRRVQDLLITGIPLDETRMAQEVAHLADRSDITEEVTRLKSHIAQFYQLIAKKQEVGKKLDFLLQEMNRETTTILSKATELKMINPALALKAEIEKLREQVQNVE
jgi:uncharacterized protein (TIGR00255 family)